jgi:plastocyanin
MLGGAMGLGAVAPASSASPQIEIRADEYIPSTLTVPAGTAVTWINHDDDVHTVTSTAEVFHSPGIDTHETFTYTFTQPGTYEYFCKLHSLMTGRIVVR